MNVEIGGVLSCCLFPLLDYELHVVKGFWHLLPDLCAWGMGAFI